MPWGFTSLPQSFNTDNLAASLVCSHAQSTNVAVGRGTNPTMFGSSRQTLFCVPYPNDQNLIRNNQLRHANHSASRETNHRSNSLFERSTDCMRSMAPGFPFNSVHNHGRTIPVSEAWCVSERRPDCVWLQPTPKRRRTSSGSLGSSTRNPASNRCVIASISSALPVPALSVGLSSLSGMPHLARIPNFRTAYNPALNATHPDPHASAPRHEWFYRCPPNDSESIHWHNDLRQVSNLVSVAAAAAAAAAAVSQTTTHHQGSFDTTVNMTNLANSQYSDTHNYDSQTTRNPRQHVNRPMSAKFHQKRFFVANNGGIKRRQSSGLSTYQKASLISSLPSSSGSNSCSSSSCRSAQIMENQSKSNQSSRDPSWNFEYSTRPPISQPDHMFSTPREPNVSTAELLNMDNAHLSVASDKCARQATSQVLGSSSDCDISPLNSTNSSLSDSHPMIIDEVNLNSVPMDSELLRYGRSHQFGYYRSCSNTRDHPTTDSMDTVGDILSVAYAACTASEHSLPPTAQNPTLQSDSTPENSHCDDINSDDQLTRLSLNRLTANLVSGTQDSESEEATVVAAAVVASAAAHAVAAAAQAVSAAVNQRRTSDISVFQPVPSISTTHPFIVPVTPTSRHHSSPIISGRSVNTQSTGTNAYVPSEPINHTMLPEFTTNSTNLDHEHTQLLSNQILTNLTMERSLRTLDLRLDSSNTDASARSYLTSNCNFTNRRSGPDTLSCSGHISSQQSRTVEQNAMPSDCHLTSGSRFVQLSPTLTLRNCVAPVVLNDTLPSRSNMMLNALSNIPPLGATVANQHLPAFTYAAQSNFVTVPTEVAAAAAAVVAVAAAANCSTTANNVTYPNAVSLAQRALNIAPPTQQCPASSIFTSCLPPLSSFTPIPLLSVRSPQPSLVGQASLSTTRDVSTLFQFLRLINQRQDSYALPYYPSAMTATARGSNQSVVVSAPGGVANGSRVASAVTPPLHPHHPTLSHTVNTSSTCAIPGLPNNPLINQTNLIFDNHTMHGPTGTQPTSSTAVALAAVAMAAAALHQQTNRHVSSNTISMLSAPRAAPTPSIPVPILHANLYYPRTVATMQRMQDTAHQQCYHNHYGSGQQQYQHGYSQRPASLPVAQPTGCFPSTQPNLMTAVTSNSSSPAYLSSLFPFLLTVPSSPTPSENAAASNTSDFSAAAIFAHYPSDPSLRIPTPVSMLPRNVPDTTSAATAAAAAAAAVAAAAVSVDRLLHWAVQLESNTRRGLTKEELDSLPVHLYSSKKSKGTVTNSDSPKTKEETVAENVSDTSEQERCMICLDDYEDEQQIRKMRCRHEFHAECVDKWLQNKRTCPLCRADAFDGTQRKELFF